MAGHTDFHKIRRLPPYLFEEVNARARAMRAEGIDIIDMGMGNPDLPTPPHIIDKLVETANKPRTNRYSVSRGIIGLRRAQARYYQRRFGVDLDPDTQIVVTLGSKEGFANLAQAISAPGDIILAPNPSYPLHSFGFIMAGASIRHVEAHSPEQYLRGAQRAVRHSVPPPTAMVLCYPANPTGQTVDLDFYADVVAFARKHELWVLSDLAYSELYFETPPPSILQIPGAAELAVETTSMSKSYSMAGLRVGFAVGNQHLIQGLSRVKSYLDYGGYTPVQVAAAAALDGPQHCLDQMRTIYKERRDTLIDSFGKAGWTIPATRASMFVWAPIPEALRHSGSVEFSLALLKHASLAVSPGIGFGEYGDGHVRISLTENTQRIRQAARSIRKYLSSKGVSGD